MDANELENRLVEMAIRSIKVCQNLPRNYIGKHIAQQLLRCSTSPAAHYAEARGAESGKDFVHKMRIGLKELNETQIWLKIIIQSQLIPFKKLDPVLQEVVELSRIFNASIKTKNSQ